jgi:hypothetical protein
LRPRKVSLCAVTRKITKLWEGPEDLHAFGNLPNFAVSRDGNISAAIRANFNQPPEVAVGPIGKWKPVTKNNASVHPAWGEAQSVEWTNEGVREELADPSCPAPQS